MNPHIRTKLLYALRTEVFCRQTKNQSPNAGQSISKAAQIITGQDSPRNLKLELDDQPTREQVKKVTMQMKVGKSPGIDGIQAEVSL